MKRRIVLSILGFALVWPLLQRGLVARYDVNPWKLFGFAMYSTPAPPVQVVAFRHSTGGLAAIDERGLPARVRGTLDRFRIERHALGRLTQPDEAGAALLEAMPNEAWVLIAVQRMALERSTARMQSVRDQYVYERFEGAMGSPPPAEPGGAQTR